METIRRSASIRLIVHYPKTEEGQKELSRRVAEVHADAVAGRLGRLECPAKQKQELLQAVIDTAKQEPSDIAS